MKQNGVVCLPGPALLFFIFRFEYLISGPKSYRDFRETGPRAHFLGRALIWPGYFVEHILGLLDYILRVCQSLPDSFFYLGKLHWFLYLLLTYYHDPGMFIFCWSSNFEEKVVLNESMAAKMASRVSYLVYYYCI